MRYYEIQVDEKIWNFLKKNAEPFEDTPNTVLNRLLFGTGSKECNLVSTQGNLISNLRIPRALSQILEVIYEVKVNNRSRTEATSLVAQKNKTTTQTVIDKYTRQLGKKAYQIDMLLEKENLIEFRSLLKQKFTSFHKAIDDFINEMPSFDTQTIATQKEIIVEDKMYSLRDLTNMDLGKNTRPNLLEIEGRKIRINNWTDLCIEFVTWLENNNKLTDSDIPLLSHSSREEKYFINCEPKHRNPAKDGQWKKVGPYFVDTKYNAEAHFRNINNTLEALNLRNIDLRISFKKYVEI